MAGTIAGLVLIGWIIDAEPLTRVSPDLASMKFNTAAAILLLSVCVFLPKRAIAVLTVAVGAIALLTLVEYVIGVDLAVDNVFIQEAAAPIHPGRMSVLTACSLLLLAWSIGFRATGVRFLVQSAATTVLAASVLTMLGYLYAVPTMHAVGPFSVPALHTAVALALLSTAALLSARESSLGWMLYGADAGARTLRVVLPWTVLALPAFGYVRLLGQRAGWFDTNFGVALVVSTAVSVLTMVMWRAARMLAKVDADRATAMTDLRRLAVELDHRVLERTAELERERESLRIAEAVARAAHAESEEANAAKDRFLSRMSHELRTPLNAVLGFAQLLELDDLTPEQNESVRHILHGGRHLLSMINDVLDISGQDQDDLGFHMEPVQLSELLTESIAMVTSAASASGVDIRFGAGQASADCSAWADRRRLGQVVLNLLSNAIKYTRPGGAVDVTVRAIGDDCVSVAVSDNGMGIGASDMPRLFDVFDRLGQQSSSIEGSGIGLALSRRLVVLMGGRLDVDSTPGLGSTFTVDLPMARAAAGG